jgi:hypothetical protein
MMVCSVVLLVVVVVMLFFHQRILFHIIHFRFHTLRFALRELNKVEEKNKEEEEEGR